jgi:hypothetical protein
MTINSEQQQTAYIAKGAAVDACTGTELAEVFARP